MKNLKIFIVAFALFTISLSAGVMNNPIKPNAELRAELVELIGTDCPFDYNKDACTAEVLFTINSNGEVIVISVISPNPKADSYIKSRINYKKVGYNTNRDGELFLLPLRIVKGS